MKVVWVPIIFLGFCANASAYDPVTHETASESAAKASVLADVSYLARIGLKMESISSDLYNVFYNSKASQLSIIELIKFGANWEDTRRTDQGKRHFFNPLTGKGSSFFGIEIGTPSPTWALEDREQFSDQPFSYRKGRQYFFNALTLGAKSERDENWGLTFQTVGHVIHHVQDMAQPQHTRNDSHCDILPCAVTGAGGFSKTNIEEWTKINAPTAFFEGYAPVYSKAESETFTSPRKFWMTSISIVGKGIAEYSNRGFFSAGTNVGSGFPFPTIDPNAGTKVDVQEACAKAVTPTPCPRGISGNVTFFATNVNDTYRPSQNGVNQRATTRSVFDSDLKGRSILPKYSVNRFTFDATNSFTLKRAVGYSAGLINYFFRGDIDLVEDTGAPGTYAIRNNGTEPMMGTFGLYYDDASDTRSKYKSWVLTIPATGQVNVGAIDPPANPAPKKSGEYMLVFNGDMGEEKKENGSVGAVVGKLVSEQTGALYVTGMTAAGQLVSLKVDPSGTRILSGPDETGNIVKATEFDPLPSLMEITKAVQPKAPIMKQARFITEGGRLRYSTEAVWFKEASGYRYNVHYIRDQNTNKFVRGPDYAWRASSQNASVGTFTFWPDIRTTGTSFLNFMRTYRDDTGVTRETSGTVPLPPISGSTSPYLRFFENVSAISPDGTIVHSGMVAGLGSGTDPVVDERIGHRNSDYYKVTTATGHHSESGYLSLVIGLEATPTVTIRITDPASSFVYRNTGDELSIKERVALPPPCCTSQTYNLVSKRTVNGINGIRQTRTSVVFLGYLSNELVKYSQKMITGDDNSVSSLQTYTYTSRPTSEPESQYWDQAINDVRVIEHTALFETIFEFPNGRTEARQTVSRKWVTTIDPNPLVTEASVQFSTPGGNPAWFGPYTLGSTNFPKEEYSTANQGTIRNVLLALTRNAADAVHAETSGTGGNAKSIAKFRDVVLEGYIYGSFFGDASPMEDVFFATPNLSVVVHEPRSSAMPRIVIPPHVFRLIAAVWL